MSVLLVVLAFESLHVCTVCIWRCEHARFCVEVFYALYINFHSFIITSTKTRGLLGTGRSGGGGGGGGTGYGGGGGGRLYTYRYTVITRMTSALRWVAMRAILMFQSEVMDNVTRQVSTKHNLSEEKGEPKRYRTEVLPLTSLTPYRLIPISMDL